MELHEALNWNGIIAYLNAKFNERRAQEYAYDLLWLLVKSKYENFNNAPMPSEVNRKQKTIIKDERTAEQILSDIMDKIDAIRG